MIEKDHRNEKATLKYRGEKFSVPDNLYIIGTMNTADRGLVMLDYALSYDFKGVLELAKKLRYEYNMRLNPALIMVRAVMHEGRKAFNEENKVFMRACIEEIINIPTDIWNQFELWMFFNGS